MKYLVILLSSAHIPHIKWTNNLQSAVTKEVNLKNSMYPLHVNLMLEYDMYVCFGIRDSTNSSAINICLDFIPNRHSSPVEITSEGVTGGQEGRSPPQNFAWQRGNF